VLKFLKIVLDPRAHLGYYEPSKEKDMEKPCMADVVDKLARDRLRAAMVIVRLKNEMLKNGPDDELEWFLDYVWEKM
jgi:hypothetical protein